MKVKDIKGFYLVSPSTVKVNETFDLKIKVLTKPYKVGWHCTWKLPFSLESIYNLSPRGINYMDNVIKGWKGKIILKGDEGYRGPNEFSFENVKGPYENDDRAIAKIESIKFSTPGVKFIKVKEPISGIESHSNPILVTEEENSLKLYWADPHSHTFFSDGIRCPEEIYSFARDEAFLDIFSISDHSEAITDRQWEYFINVANDFNKNGKFVTFIGQEWTNHKFGDKPGHRNIYYPGEKGPILRAYNPDKLSEIYKVARKYGALVIPHHSANAFMGVDWSKGHDPEVERLVEIYSIWGNSERSEEEGNTRPIRVTGGEKKGQHVIDALNRGYKFGFVGGGDIHDGRPGDDLHSLQDPPQNYKYLHRQGITGIWARNLTREEIFKALWERRVFATTNVRIILKFSILDFPMGSEIKNCKGKIPIKISAASEVPITLVTLVKNGKDYKSIQPNKKVMKWEIEDEVISNTYYYVRVQRKDGEMGWSSPIWIE